MKFDIRERLLLFGIVLVSSNLFCQVRVGADVLMNERLSLIQGKRIGLVTNHTAVLSNGMHLADALAAETGAKLVVLFGPEHGIRGDASDGKTIADAADARTGRPVFSLYGSIRKPTVEMLSNVDALLFDIQDVGARFYTYESTMSLAMEAAAEKRIPFIVLDRPNPIDGEHMSGFVLDDSLRSFVGLHRIPIRHGMTIGELATLVNSEGWLANGVKANLIVVKTEGWSRHQWYDQTGLRWINPSPNMKSLATATVYPGTCLFEGTNLSEGRGTDHPFEQIGAPFLEGKRWAGELARLKLPGVQFDAVEFVPAEIPSVASNPKHKGEKCGGVFIHVADRSAFDPVRTAVAMLVTAKKFFPQFAWKPYVDRLAGTPRLRAMIDNGDAVDEIVGRWSEELRVFEALRTKYLLY